MTRRIAPDPRGPRTVAGRPKPIQGHSDDHLTDRRLLELAEFGQRGQLVSGGITAMLIEELRAHTPDPPR